MSGPLKARSLRRKDDFVRIYREGVKRVGQFLVLYLMPAEDDAKAVVASRKVGKAVKRNRAKRLLRIALQDTIFREPGGSAQVLQKLLAARDKGVTSQDHARGLWVVAIARETILAVKSSDVCNDLRQLLP
jgi:ribonuclease P protein component